MGHQEDKRTADDAQEQYMGTADDAQGQGPCPRPLSDTKKMSFFLLLLMI